MDAHRTGVTVPISDELAPALGVINDSCYIAPNGRVFPLGSSTYAAALELLKVQPHMAPLRQLVAYSVKEMRRDGSNCELSNWIVDHLMEDVAELTGRRVDIGLINFGGIRADLPAGRVIKDDLLSMLPFNNYLCYVALKGSEIEALFRSMAEHGMQCFGGAEVVLNDRELDSLTICGEAIEPERIYGLASIDFLLDGGDGIHLGRNAEEIILTDTKVIDSILPYAESYMQRGDSIRYFRDDRLVIKNRERI